MKKINILRVNYTWFHDLNHTNKENYKAFFFIKENFYKLGIKMQAQGYDKIRKKSHTFLSCVF